MKKGSLAFKTNPPVGNLAGMEQDDRPTITIKLKPYLQEFLHCKLKEAEMLTAHKINLIGSILRPFLEFTQKEICPDFHSGDPEWITFKLPCYHDLNVRNNTVSISKDNMFHFQEILETYFKDFFFSYMDDKVRYMTVDGKRGAIKKCILQFCSDMNISFNRINYEMLKKSYYRRRQETVKKASIFSSRMSLLRPLIFLL